jgi:transposase-like protein
MPANDRNNPQRQHSSDSDFSLVEFMQQYPDDAACLDKLWRDKHAPDGHHAHCPKCDRERKFHRTTTRASYTCDTCGLHVHPMAGTIFEKSTTSLQLWFYALYLVASTRCGISAKQLERELGVTYKTAHRMMKRIRTHLMNDEGRFRVTWRSMRLRCAVAIAARRALTPKPPNGASASRPCSAWSSAAARSGCA